MRSSSLADLAKLSSVGSSDKSRRIVITGTCRLIFGAAGAVTVTREEAPLARLYPEVFLDCAWRRRAARWLFVDTSLPPTSPHMRETQPDNSMQSHRSQSRAPPHPPHNPSTLRRAAGMPASLVRHSSRSPSPP